MGLLRNFLGRDISNPQPQRISFARSGVEANVVGDPDAGGFNDRFNFFASTK